LKSFGWFKRKSADSSAALAPEQSRPPLSTANLASAMQEIESWIAGNRFAEAAERLEELRTTNGSDPGVLENLGICRYFLRDPVAATGPLLAAVQSNPSSLRALRFLAATLMAQGDHATALDIAQKALALAPRDLELLMLVASALTELSEYEKAARTLNRAIEIAPDAIEPYYRLESLSKHSSFKRDFFDLTPKIKEGRRRLINRLLAAHRRKGLNAQELATLMSLLENSAETFPAALRIAKASTGFEPMTPLIADQLAVIFAAAGDASEMVRFREFCFDVDPENVSFKQLLSQVWVIAGTEHWNEAWRMMTETSHRSRTKVHPDEVPLWTGQKLGRQKVLVYQDQGVGDAILCLRFLPMLAARGVRFDLWVLPTLAGLAAQATGYEKLHRSEERPDPRLIDCEYAVPLFGIISALFLRYEEIKNPPVIQARPDQALALRGRVGALPGVRIGLIYGGNPDRRDDWMRSLPLESVRALAALPGISWVNLMFDKRPEKEQVLEMLQMTDPVPELRSFADTAAVVEELDAVVAVDSSVAHVAGNAGKPVWVLAPSFLDWRWQIGQELSPWWPTATLLRSESPGVWTQVLKELVEGLEKFVATQPGRSDATVCRT
jgi:tetratricopeptide (TPR) repeat protein